MLEDVFHQCFRKIRITSKGAHSKMESEVSSELSEITNLKGQLPNVNCKLAQTIIHQNIQDLEDSISRKISEQNANKISEQISNFRLADGSFSQAGVWKVKSR